MRGNKDTTIKIVASEESVKFILLYIYLQKILVELER